MMNIIYLNGQYLPAEEALIPVMDRGFRFGDGVFETIRVQGGVLYQLEWHLERLQKGLSAIKITCNLQPATCNQLIQKNNFREGFLRIAISRGVGSVGYLPKPDIAPTIVIETLPLGSVPESASLYLSQFRKTSPSSLPTNYKLAQGMNSTLARMEAQEQGCFEALQLSVDTISQSIDCEMDKRDRASRPMARDAIVHRTIADESNNMLCEASSANLFWVKGDIIYTPSLTTGCLDGSTRAVLMRLMKIEEIVAPLATLEAADEVFITNCAWGVLPVTCLKPQGWSWQIGARAKQLQKMLKTDMENYVQQQK